MPDYHKLRLAELAAISECLHELDDEQWDAPSLCTGWRVRDVVSHMCVGYTTPMPTMIAKVAARRFNVPKTSFEESIAFASARTPAEQRTAGLRLRAVDVGWSHGEGPDVTGPGEAILLAASGRPVALADLEGDGVETLAARLAA